MSTLAHLGQVLQIEDLSAILYTPAALLWLKTTFPFAGVPTPLTKDVSGEYPLSILLSLYFAFFIFPLPLAVSFSATPSAYRDCLYFKCAPWSIPVRHL